MLKVNLALVLGLVSFRVFAAIGKLVLPGPCEFDYIGMELQVFDSLEMVALLDNSGNMIPPVLIKGYAKGKVKYQKVFGNAREQTNDVSRLDSDAKIDLKYNGPFVIKNHYAGIEVTEIHGLSVSLYDFERLHYTDLMREDFGLGPMQNTRGYIRKSVISESRKLMNEQANLSVECATYNNGRGDFSVEILLRKISTNGVTRVGVVGMDGSVGADGIISVETRNTVEGKSVRVIDNPHGSKIKRSGVCGTMPFKVECLGEIFRLEPPVDTSASRSVLQIDMDKLKKRSLDLIRQE